MEIEEIIEGINKIITIEREEHNNSNKGFLIVQRNKTSHEVIKIFKNLSLILWYVDPVKRIKKEVLSIHINDRIPKDKEDKSMDIISKELVYKLFEFVRTKDFENIVNGTYGE